MNNPLIVIARILQGIQVLLCVFLIYLFFTLVPGAVRFFEPACHCNKSDQSQIAYFQDTEIVPYEQCIAHPACQPKNIAYYLKKFPLLPWLAAALILLIITTVAFLRMRNWARLTSQIFYFGLSAGLIAKCYAAHSAGWTLPGSSIITGAVIIYTVIFCLVFNNYDVERSFK